MFSLVGRWNMLVLVPRVEWERGASFRSSFCIFRGDDYISTGFSGYSSSTLVSSGGLVGDGLSVREGGLVDLILSLFFLVDIDFILQRTDEEEMSLILLGPSPPRSSICFWLCCYRKLPPLC
mmetsp:Transcript_35749/g.54740  ORF Transcript_35749/g.54740 Transcript_35749/m.54740 type:complete len:122 (+) Transcript_35749:287-652(+)